MSEYQFWHGDMRLLEAYRKAYHRDISYKAWYEGMYNRIAMEMGARNALASKKKDRIDKWLDYKDPIEQDKPKKQTKDKETQEKEFRNMQAMQNAWLFKK